MFIDIGIPWEEHFISHKKTLGHTVSEFDISHNLSYESSGDQIGKEMRTPLLLTRRTRHTTRWYESQSFDRDQYQRMTLRDRKIFQHTVEWELNQECEMI